MLAAEPPISLRNRVAAAVAHRYACLGCTVVETPLAEASGVEEAPGAAVVATDMGTVECVADGHLPAAARAVRNLAAAGWEVRLLVPLALVGEAHRLLRGAPANLQPFWLGPDDDVCFGAPEVP